MSGTDEAKRANRLRWVSGDTGHYEVYYLTLNHLASKSGFWIRYTLTAPEPVHGGAYAQIWFSYFNYRSPERNFALKQRYPIGELKSAADPFSLRIGNNVLEAGHASGAIAGLGHDASWDISFAPSKTVHYHLPKFLYSIELADTVALCPNLDAHFTGTIKLDGETLELRGDPGCQTHLWGSKHAERWAWAHCNGFREDPGAVFEGLCVQVKRLGLSLPPLNLLHLRFRGRDYNFTDVHTALRCGGSFETGLWRFHAVSGRTLFRGEISCRPEDMVCAEYFDPDGERAYCHNSEVGDAAIRMYTRPNPLASWRHVDTITSIATTHAEFAARERDPIVKNTIEEIP